VVQKVLVEADGVVPSDLLSELHALIPFSFPDGETERERRLVISALEA
jgi:hypothetical protein